MNSFNRILHFYYQFYWYNGRPRCLSIPAGRDQLNEDWNLKRMGHFIDLFVCAGGMNAQISLCVGEFQWCLCAMEFFAKRLDGTLWKKNAADSLPTSSSCQDNLEVGIHNYGKIWSHSFRSLIKLFLFTKSYAFIFKYQ